MRQYLSLSPLFVLFINFLAYISHISVSFFHLLSTPSPIKSTKKECYKTLHDDKKSGTLPDFSIGGAKLTEGASLIVYMYVLVFIYQCIDFRPSVSRLLS